MRRSQLGLALVAVLALGGGLLWRGRVGAGRGARGGTIAPGAPETPLESEDFAPYLAVAHAIATHADPPATAPAPRRGARVFVTAWVPGRGPVSATARGETLYDSVTTASEAVAGQVPAGARARIEIDVAQVEELTDVTRHMEEAAHEVGLHGYLATGGLDKVGFMLPGEIIDGSVVRSGGHEGAVGLKGDRVIQTIAERAKVDTTMLASFRTTRFTAVSRVEAAAPGDPPIALFRGRPPHPTELSAAALLEAVGAGASYLARSLDDHGEFTYLYDPVKDEPEHGYDMLRHAGSIYAMMEAYGELGVPEWRDKAELAIDYLKEHVVSTPDGDTIAMGKHQEQQKAGSAGLALVALVEYALRSNDVAAKGGEPLAQMQRLARFIVHQQYPDGHFRANADVMREDENAQELKKEVSYYPGEATLGLVRLYGIDPNPLWLAAARKSADYLIHVRDAPADLKHQIHDHWLSYALHDLYVLTKEPSYAAHAEKIADAIADAEMTAETAPYPDYVGSFLDDGEATPASTRLEALSSTLQLTRFMGGDESKLRALAMQVACFVRGQQIDADGAFFAKNPAQAIGGVRRGLFRSDVRIDYVQHAMSAWLRLARLLRDPSWGKPP